MSNRTTNKQIEGMVRRLERNTGMKYMIGTAYGNHYTLEREVNEKGGVTDVVFAIGKTNFYNAIYAACRIIEDANIGNHKSIDWLDKHMNIH
jgi:hypothetical protein